MRNIRRMLGRLHVIVSLALVCFVPNAINAQDATCSTQTPACGCVLASFQAVDAKVNGSPVSASCRGLGDDGWQFQCVEYVRRFYRQARGIDTSLWRGNANEYITKTNTFGLVSYQNGQKTPPTRNDILAFDNRPPLDSSQQKHFGHVAIVTSVILKSDCTYDVNLIEQNWGASSNGTTTLTMTQDPDGRYVIPDRGSYVVQGWLRPPHPTLNAAAVFPAATMAGNSLTFVYNIANRTGHAAKLKLGASIRKSNSCIWQEDPANDQLIDVGADTHDYSRVFAVGGGAQQGTYDVAWTLLSSDGTEMLARREDKAILQVVVAPSNQPPTARFTMTSGSQSATQGQTLTVAVPQGQAANVSFSASPSVDTDGTIKSYEWNVDGLAKTTADFNLSFNVGSHPITLVVTDDDGARSAQVSGTVVVNVLPTCTLSANPSTINQGQSSILSWTTFNNPATALFSDPRLNTPPPNPAGGSTSVSPAATTTYTLTVSNPGGTNTCSTAVTVNPVSPPTQQGGPPGGYIQAVSVDPMNAAIVYAATQGGGVFKTTNGGTSWAPINAGLTVQFVDALAIDPTSPAAIYAGTSYGGVFKTVNAGASWAAVNSGLTNTNISSLVLDPTNSSTVYVGTDGGVFKTTNGGTSWTAINSGLTNTSVASLAIDPTSPATVYAGTNYGGVFKTTNAGASWAAINSGLMTNTSVASLVIDRTSPATVYAGAYSGGVFKTTNAGASWAVIRGGWCFTVSIDPSNPEIVYIGTTAGILKSTDSGVSWNAVNSGTGSPDVRALTIDPTTPATVYAGTRAGMFKTTDGGTNWAAINSGLSASLVYALAIDRVNSATLYAATYGGGVFKSTNGGASWSMAGNGLSSSSLFVFSIAVVPATPSTLYAGTAGGLFNSSDAGVSWTGVSFGLPSPGVRALVVDPMNPLVLFAGTGTIGGGPGGVLKSSVDGGASWAAVNSGLTNTNISSLVLDPTNSSTVYVGTDGGVFKTTNGGTSWTAINSGLTNTSVASLAIDPTSPATVYAGTNYGGVFKTTNAGASWAAINAGLAVQWVDALAIDPTSPATIYAGSYGGGVFKTTNAGASWAAVNSGLTNTSVASLAIDPTNSAVVYAGSAGGGVFKSMDAGATWYPTGAN